MKKFKDKLPLKSLIDFDKDWLKANEKNSALLKRARDIAEASDDERRSKAIETLSKRYKTENWAELLIAMIDDSKEFGRDAGPGPKQEHKWNDELCIMLAVAAKKLKGKKETALEDLGQHPAWKKLVNPKASAYQTFDKPYIWGNSVINKYEYAEIEKIYGTTEWDAKLQQLIAQQGSKKK
jgi:hypothetical protein